MAASSLEALVNPQVDVEPLLVVYRRTLRAAAEAGCSPDDADFAETLAGLARQLGLTAHEIRKDAEAFVKMYRLKGRFSTTGLEKAQRELDRVRRVDILFSTSGGTACDLGYSDQSYRVCESDERLADLRERRKAATDDDELREIRELVAAVDVERARLSRQTKLGEDAVIVLLNARDRILAARQRCRRLFPESEDEGATR